MLTRVVVPTVSVLLTLCASTASAQWIHRQTPGIPRTAEGRPDFAAAAPRTAAGIPDLSGMWIGSPGPCLLNVTRDLKPDDILETARDVTKRRMADYSRDDPNLSCLPQGPRLNRSPFHLAKIVQTPTLIVILNEDLTYRQIFLDGRSLPDDPNPSFMGYSVGHWEGDALVIESNGFKDRTWLDSGTTPHSEALRITERITRTSLGRLRREETFSDPAITSQPWTIVTESVLIVDTELLEYVCNENERSRQRMVGSLERDRANAVHVPAETLARYLGTYEAVTPAGGVIRVTVTMTDGQLFIDGRPLVPLSATTFAGPDQVRIETDASGYATRLFVSAVEFDIPLSRISVP